MSGSQPARRAPREPIRLFACTLATPLGGFVTVVDTQGRLRAAEFEDRPERLERSLLLRFGREGHRLERDAGTNTISMALESYFAGDIRAIDSIKTVLDGTPFQNSVWAALRTVEAGAPISYATLAARIGRPETSRAVGHANGTNPFSIIVPCHRLVGSNGALTGYGGGIERKRWLIDHEARAGACCSQVESHGVAHNRQNQSDRP
ncbi:methylated-DNA--[protein]-cysteine S-methyltransferase [Pseudaminobacter salicylatoxidans]|uniref:methylated-DNA--[protein]-cysteine S-methyltransferase n=1 Tax=Pseudaminobacter salicylatoxidans TaxID=93369 RepID=UPI0002F272B4|nr:methylated-DNA--[protein]-cysteine S-methyltransferase [Pseudaminobacter salicylatoxidans]